MTRRMIYALVGSTLIDICKKIKEIEMPKIDIDSYWDDEFVTKPNKHKNSSAVSRSASSPKAAGKRQQQLQSLSELIQIADKAPLDIQQGFTTTFKPAEHERFWLLSYLEPFYNNEVITDILWKAKAARKPMCTAAPHTRQPVWI